MVEIIFHGGGSSPSATYSITLGEQLVFDDIVGTLGGSGNGPIEIVSNGRLIVGSRTYNQINDPITVPMKR